MKSYTAEDILSLPFDHFTFVDLRTEEEYQLATIPGAIWIPTNWTKIGANSK